MTWQEFVMKYGSNASARHLAFLLGVKEHQVNYLRGGQCDRHLPRRGYAELFSLLHGRAPADHEWPPLKRAHNGYEWQGPELALLASLTGRMSSPAIAALLTKRLRKLTGDPKAERTLSAINAKRQVTGVLACDLVGGISVPDAGREIRSSAMVYQAIDKGVLMPRRVGHRLLIPRDQWDAWKRSRVFPPDGYIPLASIRLKVGIVSDKLSEHARAGLIPTAIRCNPYGTKRHSTQFGTWYIAGDVARRLVADYRAGRPMPWHGAASASNLKATWKRFRQRQHPPSCTACAEIWGAGGAPHSFADYSARYPALDRAAKLHLTRPFGRGGLLVSEVARRANVARETVARAVAEGILKATSSGRPLRIAPASVDAWLAAGARGACPKTWISLATAKHWYAFSARQIRAHIAEGTLTSKTGTSGPQRGLTLVDKQECAELRARIGYTPSEAARRAGLSRAIALSVLRESGWKAGEPIDARQLKALTQLRAARRGASLEEAAEALRKPLAWVKQQVRAGLVRPHRDPLDRRALRLSAPMMARLRQAARRRQHKARRGRPESAWVTTSAACTLAGVSQGTLVKWHTEGGVPRRGAPRGHRYHRRSVERKARRYWRSPRLSRAVPPAWIRQEGP